MYSVIESGGFQHKVTLGETLKVSHTDANVGDVITATVLLYANGSEVKVGKPHVSDAVVKLEVLDQGRGDKIIVFKRKKRKRYRLTRGHRQQYTEVIVTEIACGSETKTIDAPTKARAHARIAALAKQKIQTPKPTRKEKLAAAK